jgi:acylphosphatase
MPYRIVRLHIAGRVHGVGFRAFVEAEAEARNLDGWVRNRRDGSVEAVFAGSAEAIDEMVAVCWRGPSASRVSVVEVSDADADTLSDRRPGERFSLLPTA